MTNGTGAEAPEAEDQLGLALKALSVMRHDVRNLLASVTILAGRMEASGDERLVKAAPMLVGSMERTVEMGVRAGRLVEIVPQGRAALPLSRALSTADPNGEATVSGGDVRVLADEGQLASLLSELLANARAAGQRVRIEAAAEADRAVIRVHDDGPGIPDYALGDLFTPFKGAKRRGGTGLGLPLAARLARANGGALALERTGEDGTTFRLELPTP